jgi:RNA ligase (TIGR02306 family)
MSKLNVEVVEVGDVDRHPNADRLSLAKVFGYTVVVGLWQFKPGDLAVYFPVDSVLPEKLEDFLFKDSKVKLHKHRVRAVRIRGTVSQGLLVPITDIYEYGMCLSLSRGDNIAEALGVVKYEPPVKTNSQGGGPGKSDRYNHPYFRKYTDIQHLLKYYQSTFKQGETVLVTEKIHGTNFRVGWVRWVPRTWWHKILGWLHLTPRWEFVYGSRNVQLQDGNPKKGKPFGNNIYAKAVRKYKLQKLVPKGFVLYGEIYGPGIQKGYSYSVPNGDIGLVFFDLSIDGSYVGFASLTTLCNQLGLATVPRLMVDFDIDKIQSMLNGKGLVSDLDMKTKPVEGFVIRSLREDSCYHGRRILKLLNEEYLLNKDNTDFH